MVYSIHAREAGMPFKGVSHYNADLRAPVSLYHPGAPSWIPRRPVPDAALPVSSPQVVYLRQIGETGTIRQRLYMKGGSNEHAQER